MITSTRILLVVKFSQKFFYDIKIQGGKQIQGGGMPKGKIMEEKFNQGGGERI